MMTEQPEFRGLGRFNPLAEAAKLIKRHYRRSQFVAEVISTSGNQISIRRVGASVTEGPYAAADGLAAAVSAGDRVKVERDGEHSFLVAYKVVS